MNWISFKSRQPIDGQKVLIYTIDNEISYISYKEEDDDFVIVGSGGCVDDFVFKDDITHWASPQPPEMERE